MLHLIRLLPVLLLGSCDVAVGPSVSSRFSSNVEVKVSLTDGMTAAVVLRPCEAVNAFGLDVPPIVPRHRRGLLFESVQVLRDGKPAHRYDGDDIERLLAQARAKGERNAYVLLDEEGYDLSWRGYDSSRCGMVVSLFDEPVQADFHYAAGVLRRATWQRCEVHLWGTTMGRPGTEAREADAHRIVVSRDGAVVHDLDRDEVAATFDAYRRGWPHAFYVVDDDGFRRVHETNRTVGHPIPECRLA